MLKIKGSLHKSGKWWGIQFPLLGIATQGTSKADAMAMALDALELMLHPKKFKGQVKAGSGTEVFLITTQASWLIPLLITNVKVSNSWSLAEIARLMGKKSRANFSQYAKGEKMPGVDLFLEFLALDPRISLEIGQDAS